MTLVELATELGLSVSDIKIIPLTLEETKAIETYFEQNDDNEKIEKEYQDYLDSQYYFLENRGQY